MACEATNRTIGAGPSKYRPRGQDVRLRERLRLGQYFRSNGDGRKSGTDGVVIAWKKGLGGSGPFMMIARCDPSTGRRCGSSRARNSKTSQARALTFKT